MALVQPLPHEINSPSASESSADNAKQLVLLEKPGKERLHQLPPPRREIYLISAKIVLVLIFIISYHTFCFIVHYRQVPIGRSATLGLPFLHIDTVSVITTVAILIVYVTLWPMKDVIDEIRAEEFFRLMHTHPNGVPLDSVNAVSATTTGAFDIFMATIHCHCSPLLTSTLVISLVITAISSIAPAALSAGSIWIDIDNSTFMVGALPKDSFLKYSSDVPEYSIFYDPAIYSSVLTMAWVEIFHNLTVGYNMVTDSEDDPLHYLVPFPPEYTSTMKAYWTTDVIVLDPSCSWQTGTTPGPPDKLTWDVTLFESGFNVQLDPTALASGMLNTQSQISIYRCNNKTLNILPVDGSAVFVINQLDHPFKLDNHPEVDLSSIPTLKLPTGDVLAFLLCSAHASIQTRQVRATGNGNLTLGKPQRSQGNIDFYQANYLLSFILIGFGSSSTEFGPRSYPNQLGPDLMEWIVFGNGKRSDFDSLPYEPAPIANITDVYKQVIQSAMKLFLSGGITTENVPGGYTEEQMVFTSSLGHVYTSAVFFTFLMIALVGAQFRKKRFAFTFVNVAAALANSDVLQKCEEMMQFKADMRERKVVLKMVPNGDGQLGQLHFSI